MANSPKKSSAETYRERRKKQITHAAKKSAKKSAASEKIVRIVVTCLALVIALSAVTFLAGSLAVGLFGIPQRTITVTTVGDYKITAAEFNYYYSILMNNQVNTTKQIEEQYASTYGPGIGKSSTGYDTDKSPEAQTYAGQEEDEALSENATWSDYFSLNAPRYAYIYHKLYDEAVEKGYKLTEDELKTVDDAIEKMRKEAYENNFSLKRYLTIVVADGLNESLYRELSERETLVRRYMEDLQKEYGTKITDKEIQAYYKKNADDYDSVNFRLFAFSYTTTADEDESTYTQAQAKELADDMLDDIDSYSDFNSVAYKYALKADKESYKDAYASEIKNFTAEKVTSNAGGAEVSKWLFNDSRKAGDKTVIHSADNKAYFVVALGKASSLLQTVPPTVRHILVKFETTTDANGQTVAATDEAKKAAKTTAEQIYTDWKNGDKTEDSFIALAKEKSADTGSATEGGLIEQVVLGQMVPTFEKWSYVKDRKAGDTGIVESTYGYHIMYYVGLSDEPYWKTAVRETLGNEKYTEYMESINDEAKKNAKNNERFLNYFSDRLMENININYRSSTTVSTTVATTAAK